MNYNGNEYMKNFHTYLDTYGIIHQTDCVNISTQNVVSK